MRVSWTLVGTVLSNRSIYVVCTTVYYFRVSL